MEKYYDMTLKYRTEGNILCAICAEYDDNIISIERNTLKQEHCDCCGREILVHKA